MQRNQILQGTVGLGSGMLGEAVKSAREKSMSMRELARQSGISAAQISRIEANKIDKPSVTTLISLSKALDLNPIPLMILAGYLRRDEARARLAAFLEPGTEFSAQWSSDPGSARQLEAMRHIVGDENSSDDLIGQVACTVFLTLETEETLWDDAFLLAAAEGEHNTDLREIAQLWPSISIERRPTVLAFLRDQATLSRLEFDRHVAEGFPEDRC
jgi:transcriptional regulator with XRE-family HTH domain